MNDPWGNNYHYLFPGKYNKDKYDLWSRGADNAQGGEGYNRDICQIGVEIGVGPR